MWSMRTPCQKDIEATKEMLALVGSKKYQDMFNDQCTVKIRVWKRICEELMSKGYRIADSINEGGIKCHQKWRNLEKSYRNYLISTTDPANTTPKKPPPYFEALHEILKRKKKYANASAFAHTVLIHEQEIIETEAQGSDRDDDGGDNASYQNLHQINEDSLDGYNDEIDGSNDDHCYVVNSTGSVSKRFKVDPLAVCSTTGGVGGNSRTSTRAKQSNHRPDQQFDTLDQILEQMVRLHRDTLSMHQRHFSRVEKLMRDNAAQTKRLADVMGQLLHNTRPEDCVDSSPDSKSNDKSIDTTVE